MVMKILYLPNDRSVVKLHLAVYDLSTLLA
jgi:hypothetical protein